MKVGDKVLVHYDNSIGKIIEVKTSGVGTLFTVLGEERPHFVTPNQTDRELTLIEEAKDETE